MNVTKIIENVKDEEVRIMIITANEYDFSGKYKYIQKISAEYGIDESKILFIGNSDNDVYVGGKNVKTLLINPENIDHNDNNWNYYEGKIDRFSQLLQYIIPTKIISK